MSQSPYAKLPLSGKILIPMLSVFLGSWIVGTFSVGYIETRKQAHELSRETHQSAFQISKEIGAAQNLLSFKAKSLTGVAPLVQAVSNKDKQALLKTLLPLKADLELDFVKVINQEGMVLADLRSSTVNRAKLQDTEVLELANKGLRLNSIVVSEEGSPPLLVKTLAVESRRDEVGSLIVGYALTPEVLTEILGTGRQHIVLLKGSQVIATTLSTTSPVDWSSKLAIGQSVCQDGNQDNSPNNSLDNSQTSNQVETKNGLTRAQSIQIDGVPYLARAIALPQVADDQFSAIALTPLADFYASQRQMWLLVCSLGLVSGLIVSLVGLLVAHLITRRVTKLTEATQMLASGDLSFRISVEGSDEVATLANGFNHMAEQLNQRDLKIQTQLEELERLVNELQQMPERVHTERMIGLGHMVAGIAHEINNPINFIYGNVPAAKNYTQDLLELLRLYKHYYPQPPEEIQEEESYIDIEFVAEDLSKVLDSIHSGASRVSEIVLSLRNFARKDEAIMKPVNLHEGLDSTLVMLQHRLKVQNSALDLPIQITKDYSDLPVVECFAGEINQVFMNLLSNAIDAIEGVGSGQQTVCQVKPCPQIRIATEASDSWVSIKISDNGSGIPEDVRTQLFDPFFTTKDVGEGTGLGLSISYQIVVEKHHGKISCNSVLGKGTEFTVQLPVAQAISKAA